MGIGGFMGLGIVQGVCEGLGVYCTWGYGVCEGLGV